MLTLEKITAAAKELPDEFSIDQLMDKLILLEKIEEAADWNRYTSPEAMALYAKFPISPEVAALRGIAANLSPADLEKSAKDWEAERIREKYGI